MNRFLLLLIITAFFISCSGTKQITVHQKGESLPIDGSLAGWVTGNTLINDSEDIRYHAYIHDDILYLFADVRSQMLDMAIRQSGLIVYLSNSEENRRAVGIGYPTGTFNLLREYPGAFNGFTTDPEWSRKTENVELMRSLGDQIFERVMIVERYDGSSRPEYGFVEKSQIEIDGVEIASDPDRRLISLEMKIPLDGSTLFRAQKGDLWLGFALEPPTFRMRSDNDAIANQQARGMYGNRNRNQHRQRSQPRMLSRDDWFILRFD